MIVSVSRPWGCQLMSKSENNRRYRETHREQIAASNKAYYQENRDAILERNRAYTTSHLEETRAYKSQWYQENKERIVARQRRWKLNHPEQQRERERRYVDENREKRYQYLLQYRTRNRDYIRSRLEETVCAHCGGSATDWHHVDESTKHKKLSAMHCYSRERIDEEIEKCIPLCRSCHSKHHAVLRRNRVDIRRLT